MIKNNFNAQGYKAPVCKVVRVAMKAQLLQNSILLTMGDDDEAGGDVTNNYGGSF